MKNCTTFIALILWFMTAHACAISPFYQIATEPKRYFEKSNAVFFAKLIKVDNSNVNTQVAEFEVLDVFKGILKTKIKIINKIESNCSRMFNTIGSRYYVFGNLAEAGNKIIMQGFPSFVPETYATKMNLLIMLRAIN